MSDSGELVLERFLPYRLSVLSNRMSQALARFYAERFDLSITEWRVLAVLARHPGISANEVAERTAMDKVAVSRAVRRLLTSGRLLRDVDDGDRRRSRLRLSEKGAAIYRLIAPLALDFERRLLALLSPEDQRRLDRALERLAAQDLEALVASCAEDAKLSERRASGG
ncbi:MAG: MarR family transcriptional regulator [Lysobacterales bacterium]|jgi:DNA-binding MarR family transcriptional regulator|nr:MAG: MarR family transcriptional regulator [Xanthomonadales bacterium]